MASYSALRTRMSLNGFLPFTLLYSNSSRDWSMPMKTMRFSGPSITFTPAVLRSRATSCGAGSRMKSSSPDSSAATRVGSLLMGVNTTSCTLPSKVPHQLGLRL